MCDYFAQFKFRTSFFILYVPRDCGWSSGAATREIMIEFTVTGLNEGETENTRFKLDRERK